MLFAFFYIPVSGGLHAAGVVTFDRQITRVDFTSEIELLQTSHDRYTIDDIIADGDKLHFYKADERIVNPGYNNKDYWGRFSVKNCDTVSLDVFFEQRFRFAKYFDVYEIRDYEKGEYIKKSLGAMMSIKKRAVKQANPALKLHFGPSEQKDFIVYLKNDPLRMDFRLYHPLTFYEKSLLDYLVIGLFLGILLVVFIYNLFIYLSTKEIIYLLYSIYIFSTILMQVSFSFLGYQYLWPDFTSFNQYAQNFFPLLTFVPATVLTYYFFEIRSRMPHLNSLFLLILVISVTGSVFSFFSTDFFWNRLCLVLLNVQMILVPLFFIGLAFYFLACRYQPAKYYLIAFALFLLSIIMYSLKEQNILPTNLVTEYGMQIATSIQAIFLNLALADKISLLTREKDEAQKEAFNLQYDLAIAKEIQTRTLSFDLPESDRYKIETRYIPAKGIGGDFFGIHRFDDNTIGVMIADVVGHGIPAALIASIAKAIFTAFIPMIRQPDEFIKNFNSFTIKIGNNILMTASLVYLDFEKNIFKYARAGHEPLIVHRRQTGELLRYQPKGRIIGFSAEHNTEIAEGQLMAGDRFILYTDGIIETFDSKHQMFGITRFHEAIIEAKEMDSNALMDSLIAKLDSFGPESGSFNDDITMVVIDVL